VGGDPPTPLPVFHALSVLAAGSRRRHLPLAFSRPDVRGLAWLGADGRRRGLIANDGERPLTLLAQIAGLTTADILSAEGGAAWRRAGPGLIELGPYAVAVLNE
jgi:hypothetical protein